MLLSSGGTRTGGRLAEWDRGQNDSSRQDTPRLAGLQGFAAPSQPPASASRVSSTSGLSMIAVSMYDLRAGKSREQSQPTAAARRASLSPRRTSLRQTRPSLALPAPFSHVERSPAGSVRPHSSSGPRPHRPHLAPHPHRQSPAEGHSACSATDSAVSNQTQESENNLF